MLIQPWGSELFPPPDPYEMMNRIGACYGKECSVETVEASVENNNVVDLCCESSLSLSGSVLKSSAKSKCLENVLTVRV